MEFDEFIDEIGGFGRLQRLYFLIIRLVEISGAFGVMITVFIGATPRWRCNRFEGLDFEYSATTNLTSMSGINESLILNDTLYQCQRDDHQCVEFQFLDEHPSVVSEFNLVCGRSFVIGTVRTLQMLGVWIGAVIASQLSDSIGRKKTLYSIYMLQILGGIITSFAPNWQLYVAGHFVFGAGFGGVTSVECVYPLEFVGRKWRTLVGTLGFWGIGVMLLSILGYLFRDWRQLNMITTFSCLPWIFTYFILPESPRWLLQKRRLAEAEKVLEQIAQRNGKELVGFDKLVENVEEDFRKKETRAYTYIDLFKRRQTLKTTMVIVSVWLNIVITYYVLTYNMGALAGNRFLNMFLMGITEYPIAAMTLFLATWVGRRYTYCSYSAVTLICCTVVIVSYLTSFLSNNPIIPTIMSQLARATSGGAMLTLMLYTPELFPTVVRNVGIGAAYLVGRLAGLIAPQIVFLGTFYKLIPYIVVLVVTSTTTPFIFVLPETNGKPIDDSLTQMDKQNDEPTKPKDPEFLLQTRDSLNSNNRTVDI